MFLQWRLQVLSTLAEVAFQPEFLSYRIEKERKAVLAEAQMMNTIEYRVDCALLKYLHHENALGCRFPIGQTSQVGPFPIYTYSEKYAWKPYLQPWKPNSCLKIWHMCALLAYSQVLMRAKRSFSFNG